MNRFHQLLTGLALFGAAVGAVCAQQVVLYSSNNTETIETALEVVHKKLPNLKVQQVTGGTGTLMKRIQAESGNARGDIMWSGGFGTLGAYKAYFEPYKAPELASTPAEYRGPDNLWIGTNVHVGVIMVNTSRLKGLPMPKTWTDLMDPRWKGKFALTDPSRSGTAYMLIYGLLRQFGLDGLNKIASNAVITGSSGATYKGVATGEYAAGLTIEYAAQEFIAGGQKEIKLIYPSEGTYLAPEGMVLIKGAKNMDAAKAFYNALMSKDVQEALLVKHFRRPTRTDIDVTKAVGLAPMKSIKVFPLDQQAAAAEYEQLIALWARAVAAARR
jgi:iron(III) transport system substrate-binding protein